MKIFLLILVLAFTENSFAQEVATANQKKTYDCAAEQELMMSDLMEDVECKHDEECGWFDYGYPWQPEACAKAIINVKKESHNIKNMTLVEEYNIHCIYPDKNEKKKYDDFYAEIKKASCDIPRTYCYKGFCRIKNYALYNDK